MNESEAKQQMCPILEARSHHRIGGASPQRCRGAICHLWVTETNKSTKKATNEGECALRRPGAR